MSIAFFPLRTVRAPHFTSIRTAPPLRSSAWCLVAKTNPVNVPISLRQNHTKMAVLFSAFSFFQDSLSRRPQRGPAQPTEKKSLSPSLTRHHIAGCRLRLGCRYHRNLPRWATFSDSRPPQYCAPYPDHVHTCVSVSWPSFLFRLSIFTF
ncbi:hypothetical protein CCHR01_04647 [Colletotrichum chrysophilum]|uniref:Uncharacterized protein n=1 Tax=Colletotrichum chrysophilum TaxID=1836956 RepID=A0AAD9AQN8_9PEZI|nr:hypothetical protein CCHR01_04647 [Colletotrichum chrysophilum]